MSVNGIQAAAYQVTGYGARGNRQNMSGQNFAQQIGNAANAKPREYTVYQKTGDMLYSGGNGTGLSFYIKYADNSTEDDPIVVAKGVDENGNEFEQTIHINDINPRNASVVEMTALESYMGVDKNGGLTSLPSETGSMGLYDRTDFMDMFQNQIRDMKQLNQKDTAAYYQYSMQVYWDFGNNKGENKTTATSQAATALDADTYSYVDSSGMTVCTKDGTSLTEKALTDQRYTDKETGISWFVGEDGRPYMIGSDADKFNEMCRENGEFPLKNLQK